MNDQGLLERITLTPGVLAGKPVVKGTRLSVEFILNLAAHGASTDDIMHEYPGLHREDIEACFLFATRTLQDITYMPLTPLPA